MIINEEIVKNIAHLARLEFDEKGEKEMVGEMNKILEWMNKLNEIDTDEVEPLIHMSTELNVLREDKTSNLLEHDRALTNAPSKDSNYFRVPKVIE